VGDAILEVACGAGRFARRMASLGARVVGVDCRVRFVDRARERTPGDALIQYHVLDVSEAGALESLGSRDFDNAVWTMAVMDMLSEGEQGF
jgi:2-polyprenyl-3-methyl-5-hydroxy-6-metoxy-1,4-benzoquinol methylase